MAEPGPEGGRDRPQVSCQYTDFTRYPEGFEAVLPLLDFLPDDPALRRRFLLSLMDTLARR